MADLTQPLEESLEAVARLRKSLGKLSAVQVKNADERMLVRATAHAWFKSHRPCLAALHGDSRLEQVDAGFADLLERSERFGSRRGYQDLLKQLKSHLVALRTAAVRHVGATPVAKPNFDGLINDQKMRQILDRRWAETLACIEVGSHLAATVMLGALLEAILLARINALPNRAPVFTAAQAPRDKQGKTKPLKEWGLKNYLDVAHELGWVRQSAKDVGEVLRDYRNFIHPEKELSHGISLDHRDTSMFVTVFCSLSEQVVASV